MRKKTRKAAALLAAIGVVTGAVSGPAYAAHKFTPPNKENACQGPNDQPNCPSFR